MGKRRKRLTMAKYAKKYAKVREALFGKEEQEVPVAKEEPVILKEAKPAPEPAIEAPKPKPKPKPKLKAKPKPKAKKAPAKKKTTPKKSSSRKKKE